MVLTGHPLAAVTCGDSGSAETAVDVGRLRDLTAAPRTPRPVRLRTHLLLLVTAGHGAVEVDFRRYPGRPGSVLRLRPGQVWRARGARLDATLVSWPAGLLDARLPEAGDRVHWQLTGADEDAVVTEITQLTVDAARRHDHGPALELLRHALAVLLLRLALQPGPDRTGSEVERATFDRLREEVECSYMRTRRVEDYAARIGCSVRTLTRACLATTGRSAKQVIDDRVALEAMRLLAATDDPITLVGRRLGFTEPTNFGRFFTRETGWSPGAFRSDGYQRWADAAPVPRPRHG